MNDTTAVDFMTKAILRAIELILQEIEWGTDLTLDTVDAGDQEVE